MCGCRPLQPDDFAALKLLHQQLFPIDYDDQFFHRAVAGLDQIASLAVVAPLQALPSLRSFQGAPLHPSCRSSNSSSSFASGGVRPGSHSISSNGVSVWDQPSHQPTVKLLQAGQGQGLAASVVEQLVGFITVKPFQLQHVEPRDRSLMGFGDSHWDQDSVLYILTLGVAEVSAKGALWAWEPRCSRLASKGRIRETFRPGVQAWPLCVYYSPRCGRNICTW